MIGGRKSAGRSSRALAAWLLATAAALAAEGFALADRLHRRGEAAPLEGRTLDVTADGVLFRAARGSESGDVLVTWDRARHLETDEPRFAEAFNTHLDLSERLWRARSRVERGDYASAEPIFDELFSETTHRTDATALIVAEGLLRCRVAREARAAAVLPWLEMHRLLAAGLKPTAYLSMRPVVEAQSGLCPQLPPMWGKSAGVEQMLADLNHYVPDAPSSARLAALYARAARLSLGLAVSDSADFYRSDESWDRDAGVVVVTALVAAIERVRPLPLDVEKVMARPLREPGPLTPWALFMRGTVRVEERDLDRRREGLVDLLTIPATHGEEHRYIAGFAVERAASILDSMGRSAAAASLRAERRRTDPTHPLNHTAAPRAAASETRP